VSNALRAYARFVVRHRRTEQETLELVAVQIAKKG